MKKTVSSPTPTAHYLSCIRLAAVLGLLVLASCEAAGPRPAKDPGEASNEGAGEQWTSDDPLGEASSAQDDTTAAPAKREPCAEGRCFTCGSATCLPGFFCDEARSACRWLPSCNSSEKCSCITRDLAGCSCESRDGNLYVSCSQ